MKIGRVVLSLVLAVMAALLCATAFAQTTTNPPACKLGRDPVDPTFKWVPPLGWKLVKTDSPQPVTLTGGSGNQYTCNLPAGQVIAYPPDGGAPVVVLCKNGIIEGRPTGTTILREQLVFNVNLVGELGPQGPQGEQGEKGDTGPQGPAGQNFVPKQPLCGWSWRSPRRVGCIVGALLLGAAGAGALSGGGGKSEATAITGGNH